MSTGKVPRFNVGFAISTTEPYREIESDGERDGLSIVHLIAVRLYLSIFSI